MADKEQTNLQTDSEYRHTVCILSMSVSLHLFYTDSYGMVKTTTLSAYDPFRQGVSGFT